MASLETLRRWSPDGVRQVAAGVAARGEQLTGLRDRLGSQVAGWHGGASAAATEALVSARAAIGERVDELLAAEVALDAAAARLDQVAADLRRIETDVASAGFAFVGDGEVVDLRTGAEAATDAWSPAERETTRQRFSADLTTLIALAEDVDHRLAVTLQGVGDGTVRAQCVPGLAPSVTPDRLLGGSQAHDEDLRVRARQVVGTVAEHVRKWGVGPMTKGARQRYQTDDAFADAVDDYGTHNDAGMLARDVLLATQDDELARWVFEHPYEWAHEAAPMESLDGTPYVMDIPVQHSPATTWARLATAVSYGYLDGARPTGLGAGSTVMKDALAAKRAAHDMFSSLERQAAREEGRLWRSIAEGHSYDKHVLGRDTRKNRWVIPDMPEIRSSDELLRRVEDTRHTQPTVHLAEDRSITVEPADDHLVITNPRDSDGGTTFRVTKEHYLEKLAKEDVTKRGPADGPRTATPALADQEAFYLARNEAWNRYEAVYRPEHLVGAHVAQAADHPLLKAMGTPLPAPHPPAPPSGPHTLQIPDALRQSVLVAPLPTDHLHDKDH
ncbi:hypothetical protein [Arsenicicoccus dermatophilus]|uniref:hypothetical protein n=1 Tax=Arsenicicoccus dermatophilus TaxID=1076331 RepID=UPI00391721CD